ncbi:radical SAM protein [Chloroflexota bacterium]
MQNLKLGTNFTYQNLPNGDFVVYSTNGSAKPFVLTGKARDLFKELVKVTSSNSENLFRELTYKAMAEEDTKAILAYLETEGIFSNKEFLYPKTNPQKKTKHLTFWIHITNMCNLRCTYCYIYKNPGEMSKAIIKEILRFLVKEAAEGRLETVTLKFGGGEPVLAFALIRYMVNNAKRMLLPKKVKLRFSMITNGTVLTNEICKFLHEEKFTISVSIDGLGNFNNERLYPNGIKSVQESLMGIALLQKHKINPYILSVVSNTNVTGLDNLINYMVSRNLSINLILCRALDDNGNLILDLDLMHQELIPILRKIVRVKDDKLPNLTFSTIGLKGRRNRACSGGHTYFVVGHDGKISTCPMAVGPLEDSSLDIERDFHSVKAAFYPKERHSACKTCIWKYACAGGCDVVAKKSNDTLTPAPLCNIMKPILKELLFLEGRKIQISRRR